MSAYFKFIHILLLYLTTASYFVSAVDMVVVLLVLVSLSSVSVLVVFVVVVV